MSAQSAKPRRGLQPGMLFLILALMALSSLVTYLYVSQSMQAKQDLIVNEKDLEITNIRERMSNLNEQLEAKIQEAKELGADYESLLQQKRDLENDLSSLQTQKDLSNAQARQYLVKIQSYETTLAAKEKELESLRAENAILTEAKDSLSSVSQDLSETKAELEEDLTETEESNRKLTNVASTLKAQNIEVSAYNKRDKQESRNTFKARNIDKLTVTFEIAENQVAEAGNVDLHLRLLEPSGAVLTNSRLGSGSFERDGGTASYTKKTTVIFNNSQLPVSMEMDKPDDYKFSRGNYTVELYAAGKIIGYKTFNVK